MSDESQFAAGMLRGSSAALSGFAASELLDAEPQLAQSLGPDSFSVWKSWFADRIEDLIAAMSTATLASFVEQMKWAQSLLVARGLTAEEFQRILNTLQTVLIAKLPPETRISIEAYIKPTLDACKQMDAAENPPLVPDTPAKRLAANYLLTLLEGDRPRATELLLNASSEGQSISELYQRVLAPALAEVGRMWMAGEISIAEEHFITTTARDTMTRLRLRAASEPANGQTVLAAAVAGNQHDIGLQMVVDLFELAGWRAINLGANVPISDLVGAVTDFSADVLLLSAALPVHLPTVRDSILALRAGETSHVKVLVGGPAFHANSELAQQFGADGYATTADGAIALTDKWLGMSK